MKLIRLSFSIYWKMAGYWMADFIIQALQGIEQHAERTVNSITPICSIPFDLGYFSANTYLWKFINSQCYILLLWTKKRTSARYSTSRDTFGQFCRLKCHPCLIRVATLSMKNPSGTVQTAYSTTDNQRIPQWNL